MLNPRPVDSGHLWHFSSIRVEDELGILQRHLPLQRSLLWHDSVVAPIVRSLAEVILLAVLANPVLRNLEHQTCHHAMWRELRVVEKPIYDPTNVGSPHHDHVLCSRQVSFDQTPVLVCNKQ